MQFIRRNTMSRRDNPPVRHQCPSAAELLRQEARLDECRLPRMRTEAGRVAAHNPVGSGVQFATTCKNEE